jgi:stearoyl-CoA desaturase (delta-9 desaturase)
LDKQNAAVIESRPFHWVNLSFLVATPILAAVLVPWYGIMYGYTAFEWVVFAIFMVLTGMGITAGYHRLWSHKAYDAPWPIRLWWAIWGAAACQNSILDWSADHRRHHKHTDHPTEDPYSASRGFVYSHIGWIVLKSEDDDFGNCKDLMRDPIVMWQAKYYLHIAVAVNLILPLMIGMLTGRIFGTLMLAGLLRLVLNHHFTFFINSLAHMWGTRPYSMKTSARDNPFLAFVTYGEGYHNFHHHFQYDYRNGVGIFKFDPTKWFIKASSWVGLATSLRTAPKHQLELARLQVQMDRLSSRLAKSDKYDAVKATLEEQYKAMRASIEAWSEARRDWVKAKKRWISSRNTDLQANMKAEYRDLKLRYRELKASFKQQRRQWRQNTSELMQAAGV